VLMSGVAGIVDRWLLKRRPVCLSDIPSKSDFQTSYTSVINSLFLSQGDHLRSTEGGRSILRQQRQRSSCSPVGSEKDEEPY
jgi:hypothetical protein